MLSDIQNVRLSGDEFVRRTHAVARSLDDSEYRIRSRPGAKQLFDEVLPLAAFVRAAQTLERQIDCLYVRGSQSFDGRVWFSGPEVEKGMIPPECHVEVTTARHPVDHLHREKLEKDGSVFGGDDIHRTAPRHHPESRIESRAQAQDGEAMITNAVSWVQKVLEIKNKIEYPKPCILVIGVEPERYPDIQEWARIAKGVTGLVDRERFSWAAVVHWPTNMMFVV